MKKVYYLHGCTKANAAKVLSSPEGFLSTRNKSFNPITTVEYKKQNN